MDLTTLMAILAVASVLVFSAYLIRTYGGGAGARSVICPHMHERASISTSWKLRLGVASCDVLQCSLLPGGKPVTCDKGCLVQL
jgi:hypothetical protein